ncbi:dipeptidylpeptidase IV [Chloropicon primus]|uniref:Dipeptidylpeptidase IV n=2 Tax=Chloropicon primus TaxID=1764295 RepID=A0A5B8MHD0_9CHLO|nr:dipeptidylpeptidase IV [Chloropicon primus]|eukprot:QDZ19849.1 dipeptidylpeptidase IV [Chloropicon primus]
MAMNHSSNCDAGAGGRKRGMGGGVGAEEEGGEQTNAWKRQAQSVVDHDNQNQNNSSYQQHFGSTNKAGSPRPGFPSDRAQEFASIQVQDVVRYPLPGCDQPTDFSFSPGGSVLCTLYSEVGTLQRSLHVCKINTDCPMEGDELPQADFQVMIEPPSGSGVDEKHLSLEEKLRRERRRERGLGITRYFWSKSSAPPIAAGGYQAGGAPCPFVMIPLPDGVHIQSVALQGKAASGGSWSVESELRKVIPATAEKPVLEPTISPDGQKISYVCNGNLYCYWIGKDATVQLTTDAKKGVVNGLAEYVAQEEMDRRTGHWWSPDSLRIAFTQVDTTHMPSYRIKHLSSEDSNGMEEEHEYPFVGKDNAKVRLGVIPVEEPTKRFWTDVQAGGEGTKTFEEYIPRVGWFPDGRLYAQLQDRKQQTLQLAHFDQETGKRTVLVEEKTNVWHNLNNCFRPLCQSSPEDPNLRGGFIWASERDGFMHLYLYSSSGACLGQLTSGEWMVDSFEGVDEVGGLVYFTGTADSELERHLYCVPLSNYTKAEKEQRRVTTLPGMHHVVLDPTFRHFVDIHDSPNNPPQINFCSLRDGKVVCVIHKSKILPSDDRLQRLSAQPPELVTIPSKDGTMLHGAVYRPDPEVYGPGPYKTLLSVYGGPHVQVVSKSWILTVDMRAQLFRAKGYLVFKLDNRGSARRGLHFEGSIQHKMGDLEIDDQVCGVKWLEERRLADPKRVGIYGWSYGGYMSAMALAKAPEVFKAAVAGAPVTSWDGYDTHYTERYMGLYEENKECYVNDSSVIFNAPRIRGKLFLIHGMIDENVHFRHTVRLIKALNSASIEYDLLLFPSERHMPRGLQDRIYMEKRIASFFDQNL